MRTVFLAVILTLCAAALSIPAVFASDSWLMQGHDARATNFNPGETGISQQTVRRLRTVWSYPRVLQAVATGKRVFAIVTTGGLHENVVALDAATGRLVRTFTAASLRLNAHAYDNPLDLAYGQGKLVIGATSAVIAVNPDTGKEYWRVPGGAAVLSIMGGMVYTGKGCQNPCGAIASYAIDLATGRFRWQHPGNAGGRPVLIGGHLYQSWGMYMPSTRVYDPQSGGLVATLPLTAAWTGDDRTTYADVVGGPGKSDWLGEIGGTGKPRWKIGLGSVQGNTAPVLAYNTLYVASNRFHPGLLAVNAGNGQVRWASDLGPHLACAAANHLIFALHGPSGRIDVLSAGSGAPVARLQVQGGYGSNPQIFVSAGILYAVDGGTLAALRG